MVMIKYLVAVLFFSFQVVIAMDMDIELADLAADEQTLLLKKSVINIALLRFDQINQLFVDLSPVSIEQAKKNSSSDMAFICDVAMLPKVLRQKIIAYMLNEHQQAMEKFCKKTLYKAFLLYDEIKKSLQDSNKEIGPLFALPKNDRKVALKVLNPLHYSYPIINQFDYEKICSQDQLREYVVGKEVFVVRIPIRECPEGTPTTGRCRDISSIAGIVCCLMGVTSLVGGGAGVMIGKTLGECCCAGKASPFIGGCCCILKNPVLQLGLPMGAICSACTCAFGHSVLETEKEIQKIKIEDKKDI